MTTAHGTESKVDVFVFKGPNGGRRERKLYRNTHLGHKQSRLNQTKVKGHPEVNVRVLDHSLSPPLTANSYTIPHTHSSVK